MLGGELHACYIGTVDCALTGILFVTPVVPEVVARKENGYVRGVR